MYIERKPHMEKSCDGCTSVVWPMYIGQNGRVIRQIGRCTSVAFFLAKMTVTDEHPSRPMQKSARSDVHRSCLMLCQNGRCASVMADVASDGWPMHSNA
jgi:hypothetical protein